MTLRAYRPNGNANRRADDICHHHIHPYIRTLMIHIILTKHNSAAINTILPSTMASITSTSVNNFGRSTSTQRGYDSAITYLNAYRNSIGLCKIEDSSADEFENDNLENFVFNLCTFSARTLIPKHFDGNLQPRNPGDTQYLKTSSIEQYLQRILLKIREMFPNHPHWQGVPTNTGLSPTFKEYMFKFNKESEAFQIRIRGSDDFAFGNTDILSIFMSNHNPTDDPKSDPKKGWYIVPSDNNENFIHKVDAVFINRNLLKNAVRTNCNLEDRAIILSVKYAAGRGGKPKFLTYKTWKYVEYLQGVDCEWTSLKTRNKFRLYMPCHANKFSICWWNAMACFWSVGRGLKRTDDQKKRGIASYVFPSLHSKSSRSASSHVTDVIRRNLPPCTTNQQRLFSAKSLRRGSITEIGLHRQCGLFDVTGRSGHSTNTSIDHYNDGTRVERSIPGGRALAGWYDVTCCTKLPRLECLGEENHDMVMKFMADVFNVDVPEFKPNGHLYPCIHKAMACLLKDYTDMDNELGVRNIVCEHLRKCADAVNLTCARNPTVGAHTVLMFWSATVKDDWCKSNHQWQKTDIQLVGTSLDALVGVVGGLGKRFDEHKAMLEQFKNHEQRVILEQMDENKRQYERMHEGLESCRIKLRCIRTPPTGQLEDDRKRKSPTETNSEPSAAAAKRRIETTPPLHSESSPSFRQPSDGNYSIPSTIATSKSMDGSGDIVEVLGSPSTGTNPPSDKVDKPNKNNRKANNKSGNNQATGPDSVLPIDMKNLPKHLQNDKSNKGLTLATLLDILYQHNYFRSKGDPNDLIANIKLPDLITENSQARYCLELVDYIMTGEDRKLLCGKKDKTKHNAVTLLCDKLEESALTTLTKWEATVAATEGPTEPSGGNKRTRKKKPGPSYGNGYQSLGKRILEYKKKILEGLKMNHMDHPKKAGQVALCPAKDIKGDPKQKKIGDFFLGGGSKGTTQNQVVVEVDGSTRGEPEGDEVNDDPEVLEPNVDNNLE